MTLVPGSENNLMNDHELREANRSMRLYAELLKRDLELSLASIAYTLNVKYNTRSAIF